MSDNEWRPKVGERVAMYGVVIQDDGHYLTVKSGDNRRLDAKLSELSPLPSPAAPHPAWEVLSLAADLLVGDKFYHNRCSLRREAARLKAAAAPKPLTLAEAVRGWANWRNGGPGPHADHVKNMLEALAREEAEKKQ